MAGSDDLVPMLAQALGTQKAREVVENAAQKLGLVGPHFSRTEVLAILESLASGSNATVAIVARFARARVLLQSSDPPPPPSVRPRRS